jgi:hypothetical protein
LEAPCPRWARKGSTIAALTLAAAHNVDTIGAEKRIVKGLEIFNREYSKKKEMLGRQAKSWTCPGNGA